MDEPAASGNVALAGAGTRLSLSSSAIGCSPTQLSNAHEEDCEFLKWPVRIGYSLK